MAIRRCPYCKAIIDETDKYCNNCGTQLLFPEDENIEEDIPGDKIVEEEEEEEEEEKEEEEFETAEEKEFEEASWEEEEMRDEEEGEGEEEEKEERELAEGEEEWPEEKIEEEEEEEEFRPELDLDKKYRVTLENDELIFKTKEIEGVSPLADEEKGVEEAEKEEEIKIGERLPETGEALPPWASEFKEVPPLTRESEEGEEFGEQELEREERQEMEGEKEEREEWRARAEEEEEEEEEIEETEEKPSPRVRDSGIGIPESVTQTGFLFAETEAVEKPTTDRFEPRSEQLREVLEGASIEPRKEEETALSPPLGLRMKSKIIDLIFITAVWLISLWFAAQVMDTSFFRLFTKSPLPILGFYLILLLLYFFLFLYFLGETLGDHYFSGED